MPQERYQNILIIGGGIGGLVAGLALARKGITSQIFERRKSNEPEGAGIQIGPNGVAILRALGVAELFKGRMCEPKQINVRLAETSATLTNLPLGAWIAARHDAPYWTLRRCDLHAGLLQAIENEPLIELHNDAKITAVSERERYVTLSRADGTTVNGRAVIDAGGVWSETTASSDDTTSLQPTGKVAFRAIVPASSLVLNNRKNETNIWLHPGAHVVSYPVYGGHERALVLILDDTATHTNWDREVANHALAGRISTFSHDLKAVLDTVESWRTWPLFIRLDDVSRRWSTPRTTKLGDAAAPVLPFLAQGGVMALEDAAVLANCIETHGDNIAVALEAYEKNRRPRHAKTAEASRNNGHIYHLSGLMAAARNTSLRLIPGERMMQRYDWLYGWKLPSGNSL